MSDAHARSSLELAYQVLASRRVAYDQMAWQTPALAFTAQAFLMTIALSGGSTWTRIVAAALALIVALLSIQLLKKHHHMELIDSVLLEQLEDRLGIAAALRRPPLHAEPKRRRAGLKRTSGAPLGGGVLVDKDAPRLWIAGQWLFAATSAGVIVAALVDSAR